MSAPNAPSRWKTLLGAAIRFRCERALTVAIPHTSFAHVLEAIRELTLSRGQAQQDASSLTWTHKTDIAQMRIGLTTTNERPLLWFEGQYAGLAAVFFVATIFAGLFFFSFLVGLLLQPENLQSGLAIFLTGVVLSYILARQVWKYLANKRQQELQTNLDRLADYLEQADLAGEVQAPTERVD